MKFVAGLLLLVFSFYAQGSERDDLLQAWENIQTTNPQVKTFEKISDGKYKIKFAVLPYDGEVDVLTYDTEDLNYDFIKDNPYSKRGYVNVDLVNSDEKTLAKYGRSYYNWVQSNTLYLDKRSGKWVSSQEYNKYIVNATREKSQGGILSFLADYWDFILLFIIIYFIFSAVLGGRQLRKSVKMQAEAVKDMDKSRQVQDEAIALHKETNKLLGEILEELRK